MNRNRLIEALNQATVKGAIVTLLGGSPKADNTIGRQKDVSPGQAEYHEVAVKNDRKSKIHDCRDMDTNDPRIKRCHTLLSFDASVGGFNLNINSALNERIKNDTKEITDLLISDCNVTSNLNGWIYKCLLDGDLVGELGIDDAEAKITRIKRLEPVITYSRQDIYGNFPTDKPAYYQEDSLIYGQITAEFWKYQIAHCGWERFDGDVYGNPLFTSARKHYRRLDEAEKSAVAIRKLDAGDHITFNGLNTQKEQMDFKEANKDSLDNPFRPVNVWYLSENLKFQKHTGSRNLGELSDLKYFEGLVVMASGVPIALLSGGREEIINRDVFEDQLKKYYSTIASIDNIIENWLREIFSTALLLKGITPESVQYSFNWSNKDRDDIDLKIERGLKLQQLGYPFVIIHTMVDLDGVEYEDVIERVKEQIAEGVIPYGMNAKLDPNLMALLGNLANSQNKGSKLAEDISKLRELAEAQLEPSGDMGGFRRL